MSKGHPRRCAVHGCGTRLCKYNPNSVCFLHSMQKALDDFDDKKVRKATYKREYGRARLLEKKKGKPILDRIMAIYVMEKMH